MSLISVIVIAIVVFFFSRKLLRMYRNSREYKKVFSNLSTQWDGWIELASKDFKPLMLGKILYSFDGYIIGVGGLVKEHLPEMLISDIDTKIGPDLLDGHMPLSRFLIDIQGQEVVLTELKNQQLKDKLKAYVDEYSKIKLLIGFESDEYVLIDTEDAKTQFEEVWQSVMTKKKFS